MVGRGFYLYFKKNVLYFKLGFSHVIKLILPFHLKIKIKKKRKKNFISLLGNNFKNISFLLKIIRSFRGPNLYSKRVKGIALYNEFIPRGTNSYSKF
jgi:ribosomal protein L6P/L9E